MPVFIILAAVATVVFALRSVPWFFRDGEDADRSMQRFADGYLGPFSIRSWWMTTFGSWLSLSIGAGVATYHLLLYGWVLVKPVLRSAGLSGD